MVFLLFSLKKLSHIYRLNQKSMVIPLVLFNRNVKLWSLSHFALDKIGCTLIPFLNLIVFWVLCVLILYVSDKHPILSQKTNWLMIRKLEGVLGHCILSNMHLWGLELLCFFQCSTQPSSTHFYFLAFKYIK